MANIPIEITEPTNGAQQIISIHNPYSVQVEIRGSADLLFHRWNCESVAEKARASKNSKAKKTDNIESYVWRNDLGELCLPGEYLRQAIIHSAKFKQDPRSPRKSAMDLFKASVVCETQLASLGAKVWDYLDTRRVVIQRSGINRTRPAMKVGWKAEFVITVLCPEYIDENSLHETIATAGRLIGVGDFRPSYGRFMVTNFQRVSFGAVS